LNIYSFILVLSGALALLIPLYLISKWFWILQGLLALIFFVSAGQLFSAWDDKKIKREILIQKNKEEFRPDTFEQFVQAPCGRLLTRDVLSELGKSCEYKSLLKYRKSIIVLCKEYCVPQETIIYRNEDYFK